MKRILFATAIAFAALTGNKAIAQEENASPLDTLASAVQKIHNALEVMDRIHITGYVQSQYQTADSGVNNSFAGGSWNSTTNNRFLLRRARIKFTYGTELSQLVMELDAISDGVTIKDLYAKFTEPWLKAFSLSTGCMVRPFGFENTYSSSMRESPEYTRLNQLMFPKERDFGAMITFQMPKTSKWNFIKADLGLFNGTTSSAAPSEFDSKKDLIGNVGINRTCKNEKINYAVRASIYNGGFYQNSSSVYKMGTDSLGANVFQLNKDTANYGAYTKRSYKGLDAQMNIDWFPGITTLRGEYIFGTQTGTDSSSASATSQPKNFYERKFSGASFYLLQNIRQSKHQLILKYDWYDPNTDVKGDEIGKSVAGISGKTFKTTNATDLKYSTFGIGWAYHWDNNIKITAYYDIVKNETSSNLLGYHEDRNDNVFTLRLQYKF